MIPFLKAVAKAYVEKAPGTLDNYCFLFPNKRSCTFFHKYLKELLPKGGMIIAPRLMTISDFIAEISGLVTDSSTDLLFTLYDEYRKYMLVRGVKEVPGFDSFMRWGEAVLQDFNDVDLFLVDHKEVFKNVKDSRSIASNFLTENQIEVMINYFNYDPRSEDINGFWKNFNDDDSKDPAKPKGKFMLLWQILSPLYENFTAAISARGLATQGSAARKALENLRNNGETLLRSKGIERLVTVGFNVLSMSEFEIFRSLKSFLCGKNFAIEDSDAFTDFYWDAAGPVLNADEPNSASRFVKYNMEQFPSPEWSAPYLEESDVEGMPELVEITSPSNSMQAKIAASVVEEIKNEGLVTDFSNADVAVVLPDESLLFPLLHSLPAEDLSVNLTMGYPLRQTSAISLVALLRQMLSRRRVKEGSTVFYKPDLKAFLSHPLIQTLGGVSTISTVNDFISSSRSSEIGMTAVRNYIIERARNAEEAASRPIVQLLDLIASFPDKTTDAGVESAVRSLEYMGRIIAFIKDKLRTRDAGQGTWFKAEIDVAHLDVYSDALRRLADCVSVHKTAMTEQTVLYLADRLLGAEKVQFEGEPLIGLQVMGLLETRGLDFDYLIIPSLNERIFPRRARSRSFIPDTVRKGFCMPPSNYQESLFSYYFFRMISRAKKVWMIYDGRMSTGGKTSEPSRYLQQLRHLYAGKSLRQREYSFELSENARELAPISKTKGVMDRLDEYRRYTSNPSGPDDAGRRNFSASALQRYLSCQAKFYYEVLVGIKQPEEVTDDIDAISFGKIFHKSMEELYPKATPGVPKVITADVIDRILNDTPLIERTVRKAIATEHFRLKGEEADKMAANLPGGPAMIVEGMADTIRKVIEHDRRLTPFTLLGAEIKDTLPLEVKKADGSTFNVNMKFAIDRLDHIPAENNLRIVDYKTGSVHLEAAKFEDIFSDDYKTSNIFQLFLYAQMLGDYQKEHTIKCDYPEDGKGDPDPSCEIYQVLKIDSGTRNLPKIEKKVIRRYSEVSVHFREGLDRLMSEIYNPDIPFRHTDNPAACAWCHLRELCGR